MRRTRKGASVRTCRSRQENCQTFVCGFAWKQSSTGYDRYMIRRCLKCGDRNIEKVHWVETNMPTCMSCLSQTFEDGDIEALEEEFGSGIMYQDSWPICSQCKSKHGLVLRI